MLPSTPSVYPEYVADQVLTAHDLNESFRYLDEQGRMTRTNLVGIGIVCGLHVQVGTSPASVTITKGVGVTSEGYLITVPTIKYTKFAVYDALKDKVYDRFVNAGPPQTKKFDLWELKQESIDPAAANLSTLDLNNKVVMLFVELLQVGNKNCDPNSCDDKGKHYEVTFRPLLVAQNDAISLIGANDPALTAGNFTGLPDVKMKRFDVPNTNPVSSQDIFDAYKSVLNNAFFTKTETVLTQGYSVFSGVIADEYPSNPFAGLASNFSFINNSSLTADKLIHIQYYYDLFSDFLLAYEEFRKAGTYILSVCSPGSNLFPRHLLLGEIVPVAGSVKLTYRHYFIYSPLFERRNLIGKLKSLFKKMVLLKEKFLIPAVNSGSPASSVDPNIRITPSKLDDVGLSQKAIPYYYDVAGGTSKLFSFWNYEKTIAGRASQNLSYHAPLYNATDDFVTKPLQYDLEPYNFLRIEGIIGKPYVKVLRNIKKQITQERLPVDVIALNTDNSKLFQGITSLSKISSFRLSGSIENKNLLDMLCHFQDLEAMYDAMKSEMLCMLCKELKYYYDLKFTFFSLKSRTTDAASSGDQPSKVGLFNACSKGYIVRKGTFGFLIEKVYDIVGDEGNITIQSIADALDIENMLGSDTAAGTPGSFSNSAAAFLGNVVTLFEIPVYIIRLANTFTVNLSSFDVDEYCKLHKLLAEKANSLKFIFNMFTAGEKESLRTEAIRMNTGDNTTNTTTVPPAPPVSNTSSPGSPPSGVAFTNDTSSTSLFRSLSLTQNNPARMLLMIFLLEDFFDHLDALIYNCKCSAFKSLKTEYLKRLAHLTLLRQFGYFTKMHPGIQHKAGVPMGGTFIIVYHSRSSRVRTGSSKGRFMIKGVVVDDAGSVIPGATLNVEGTSRAVTSDAEGEFSIVVNELPVTLKAAFTGFEAKEVEVVSEERLSIVLGDDSSDNIGENVIDNITEGTVIADFYLPYRCCSDCPPIQYVVRETAETRPDNKAPRVEAGPDQNIILPVDFVTVNGSATDPDGTITSFSWVRLSGPNQPDIVTAGSAQTDIKGLVQGVYEFELTVKDDKGDTARDSLLVIVNPPAPPANQPPVANAGPDIVLTLSPTNNTVFLDGSASSDPEGLPLTFLWSLKNGPNVPQVISPNSARTAVSGLMPGAYEFTLTVTDNGGLTATDDVVVKVSPAPNRPPVAEAGNNITITLPDNSVTLNGRGSDPDGDPITFAWTKKSGPNDPAITPANTATTQVSGMVEGSYTFEFKVTDDKGAATTDEVTVIVNPAVVVTKVCGPLSEISGSFTSFMNLQRTNRGPFAAFSRLFASFGEVTEYFKLISSERINDRTPSEQIDFFAAPFNQEAITRLLQKWLQQLSEIIISNTDLRLIALLLYRILVQLAMYIVCIQKGDFNAATARIPMANVFETIIGNVNRWAAIIQQFTPEQKDIVKKIGEDINSEMARVTSNGEANEKRNYMRNLKAIVTIIDNIP